MTGNVAPGGAGKYGFALSVLASLFFMWGFITVLDDILVPHLKAVFDLNYVQSMMVQFVWYVAYFVVSLPSARLLERIGYKKSLVIGLIVMAVGALVFVPAAELVLFPLFLLALFVLASGITLLQVAANPYAAVIGPPETASSRLNLVQAMNSAGTMIAPLFGSILILARSKSGTVKDAVLSHADRLSDARSVELPYIGIVVVLLLLAVVFAKLKLPELGNATRSIGAAERSKLSLWNHPNLVFGVPAIFIYLIAEICVGSLFISFVTRPDIANLTASDAGHYLVFLWGGMMVGRFVGSAVMQRVAANKVLAFNAVGAFLLLMAVTFGSGPSAMWALIAVGLFHSIMFPTIFTLGIKDLGPLTEEGSGLLIMAIAGGALSAIQGWLADHYGLQLSFLLPTICEIYIFWYALWGSRTGPARILA